MYFSSLFVRERDMHCTDLNHQLISIRYSLLTKISEMEEEFDKPSKGRPKKGQKTGENDAKGLSRAKQKKVNAFMVDLKGLMEGERPLCLTKYTR